MTDDTDPLVDALRRKCDAQAKQIDDLEQRLSELERLVEPDPGQTDYETLTKAQKVYRVRKALVETAANTNGRDAMKYKAVIRLFDGHPSPGHAYTLMENSADLDGFAYDTANGKDGEKRIRVKLEDVNDDALVHAANKASRPTPA